MEGFAWTPVFLKITAFTPLTPNAVELIPTFEALSPPRRARPGPGPHTFPLPLSCLPAVHLGIHGDADAGIQVDLLPEDKGPYALTPNTVELIPTLGALSPPRRARPGPGPHSRLGHRSTVGRPIRVDRKSFRYVDSGASTRGVASLGGVPREQKMLKGHLPRV